MAQPIRDLPIGSKIYFGSYRVEKSRKEPIIWTVAAKNHPGYPDNSVTLLSEYIIDLHGMDAQEPNNPIGNSDYTLSNIRQWLNIFGEEWFEPTHEHDTEPTVENFATHSGYSHIPGFLSSFTEAENDAILYTDLNVLKIADNDSIETIQDKVFLLSQSEVDPLNTKEGSVLELFANGTNDSRKALITLQAVMNSTSSRNLASRDGYDIWFLRTPEKESSGLYKTVKYDGKIDNLPASWDCGIRPAMNVDDSIMVSDFMDENGIFTVGYTYKSLIFNKDDGSIVATEMPDQKDVDVPKWEMIRLLENWVNESFFRHGMASCAKDNNGMVHLRGKISRGTTTDGTIIFILEKEYRPVFDISVFTVSGADENSAEITELRINRKGEVSIYRAKSGYLWLTGISFPAF
jgi:hypothetical protein